MIALLPIDAAPTAEKSIRMVTWAADVNLAQATVSPDGRWVGFRVGASGGHAARIAVVPAGGGDRSTWRFVTRGVDRADKTWCWSGDGRVIYFTSGRSAAMNVWASPSTRPAASRPGEPFQVTKFEGPGTHIFADVRRMELGVGGGRLVVPIVRPIRGALDDRRGGPLRLARNDGLLAREPQDERLPLRMWRDHTGQHIVAKAKNPKLPQRETG